MGKIVVKSWEVSPKEIGVEKLVKEKSLAVIYKKYPSTQEEEKEGLWYDFEEWYFEKVRECIKELFSKYGFAVESIDVEGTDDFGEWIDFKIVTKDSRRFLISLKVYEVNEYYDHTLKDRVIEVTYRALEEIERDAEAIAKTFNDLRNLVSLVASTYGVSNLVELLWKEVEFMDYPSKLEFIEKIVRKIISSDVVERKELRAIKCGNSVHVAVKGISAGEEVLRAVSYTHLTLPTKA